MLRECYVVVGFCKAFVNTTRMQRNAYILALTVALWIGALPLFAQLQPGGNPFHSDFERAQFAHVEAGEATDALSLFLCAHPEVDAQAVEAARTRLDALMGDALADARPQARADALFRGLRTRLFQRYAAIADVHAILQNGTFNCVSATALMAIAYERIGIDVEIQEQPRHVFLYAEEAGHRLRIETTAADFGAIREAKGKAVSGKPDRKSHQNNIIETEALVGLQYYNQGLAALDASAPAEAMDAFRKAALLYPSARVTEMLPVAATACKKAGLAALLRHDWDAALSLLERAAMESNDTDLDVALSAAVLARAEQAGDWSGMLTVLRAYAEWRPALCRQAAMGASYADALLASAAHGFSVMDTKAGFAELSSFEALHADFGCTPDPAIAAAAYQAAFREAVRANALPLAEHCLQMGLRHAPSDSRLKAQWATFSQR